MKLGICDGKPKFDRTLYLWLEKDKNGDVVLKSQYEGIDSEYFEAEISPKGTIRLVNCGNLKHV